jgi:hypothetical protein
MNRIHPDALRRKIHVVGSVTVEVLISRQPFGAAFLRRCKRDVLREKRERRESLRPPRRTQDDVARGLRGLEGWQGDGKADPSSATKRPRSG